MYIIALLIEILLIRLAIKFTLQAFKPRQKTITNRIPKEKPVEKSNQISIEKALKQQEKEMQQAEKNRQKQEQAAADKMFLESQLDRYTEMLNKADNELSEIERQIKIDYNMRSYDKAAKKEKRKEQIIKHIISLESKVHAIETKLAKANYILRAV